jgi:phenylacetate-CoA ligase
LPLIERIDGRASELVTTPDGRTVAVADALFHAVPGVAQVQVVQFTLTRFELRVVCAHDAEWTTVRAALAERARAVLGEASEVAFHCVELIPPEPNGKVRSVISHYRP